MEYEKFLKSKIVIAIQEISGDEVFRPWEERYG